MEQSPGTLVLTATHLDVGQGQPFAGVSPPAEPRASQWAWERPPPGKPVLPQHPSEEGSLVGFRVGDPWAPALAAPSLVSHPTQRTAAPAATHAEGPASQPS